MFTMASIHFGSVLRRKGERKINIKRFGWRAGNGGRFSLGVVYGVQLSERLTCMDVLFLWTGSSLMESEENNSRGGVW